MKIEALKEFTNILISAKRYDIVNEMTVLTSRTNIPDDKVKLKSLLIKTAKANKFSDKDYYNWGYPGYNDKKENEEQLAKFKTFKLGYCYRDDGDNYICYNFKDDTFHFFNHEESGCDNMNRKAWSIDKVYNFIKEALNEASTSTLISTKRYDISNEAAKIINKKNPGGCQYPCSNLKIKGVNVSIRDGKGVNMEEQLSYLEKDISVVKANLGKVFKDYFLPWVIAKEDIDLKEAAKGLKLYDIEFSHSNKRNVSEFEFCFEAIKGTSIAKIADAVALVITVSDGKISKTSAHDI